jgi:hypothetical protein
VGIDTHHAGALDFREHCGIIFSTGDKSNN